MTTWKNDFKLKYRNKKNLSVPKDKCNQKFFPFFMSYSYFVFLIDYIEHVKEKTGLRENCLA